MKELAHVIMKIGKSKICRAGWLFGDQGKIDVTGQVQKQSVVKIPSSLGDMSFLLRPSTDWMSPTHIMEGNVLDSKSTDLTVILI